MGKDVGYAGGGSEVVAMKSQPITLRGPAARGSTVSASVLHRFLGVLLEGCQRAVRLTLEGRSTTAGEAPSAIVRGRRAHDPVLCASEATFGLAAIMGKWPGDESDEEIAEILERLS